MKNLSKAKEDTIHFITEESGKIYNNDINEDAFWIIDPIDGTTNFLHGIPHFAISVAPKDQMVNLKSALILDPIKNEIFFAEKDIVGLILTIIE
ncbi:MAG: inositol monophosphatase family protein [Candidatus Pelagibacter sp.]